MSKKICFYLFFVFGLLIFMYGLSQTYAEPISENGYFGVGSGCQWTLNKGDNSFVVKPAGNNTTCTLENDSKDAWANYESQITSFKIKSGIIAPTDMSYFFQDLGLVENIDINKLDVSNVENMESVFYEFGSGVTELDLSNWDTSNVENMQSMFLHANVKSLKLGQNFNTSNVKKMESMFASSAFEELTLDFDTTKVIFMDYMFDDANYLTKLDISEFDMSKFEHNDDNPSGMFANIGTSTASGTEIKINDTFKKSRGDGFYKYRFPNLYYKLNGGKIFELGELYIEIKNLSGAITLTPVIPSGSGTFGSGNTCQWTLFDDGSFVIEPNPNLYVQFCELENLGDNNPWYIKKDDIKSFTIKPNVKAPKNMFRFFEDLTYIETMDVNNLDVSSTTNMFCAFCGLSHQSSSGLNELDLSSWNTPKVENMEGMFTDANIKHLKLGNGFDTSNVNYFENMFAGSAFEELILNFDTSKVNFNMEFMFAGATKLKKLDISSFDMTNVLQTSITTHLPGWIDMFKDVGKDVPEGTTIKLNNTFADKVDDLNFPAPGYKLECDNGGENFLYKDELQSLNSCSYTGTLTPAYYVAFIYNDGKNGSAGRIFLPGEQIDTKGITPTKSGHILLKWTDTHDGTNAKVKITAGAKSQSGYGAYYADVNLKRLYAQWMKDYKVLEGDNQTYTKGSNTDIVIKTNGDGNIFGRLFLDNNIVALSNFATGSTSSGMTLTLESSYLETLSSGNHTIDINFSDGYDDYTITANLVIKNNITGNSGGSSSVYSKNDTQTGNTSTGTTSTGNTSEILSNNDNKLLNIDNNLSNNDNFNNSNSSKICEITGDLLFIDLEDSFAKCYINYLAEKGIFKGYEDGTIRPENDISRAEFLAITMRSLEVDLTTETKHEFADLSETNDWNKYVNKALELGIISKDNTKFRPDDPITREEAMKILLLTMGIEIPEVEVSSYKDVTGWSVKYIEKAREMKLISSENENFRPQDNITRAEIAKIVYNVISLK